MKRRLPHLIHERTRHCKMVWYFRRQGQKRIRLPDLYGSPEFLEAYDLAAQGIATRKPKSKQNDTGTWSYYVHEYLASRAFLSLAYSTQKQRRKLLQDAARQAGGAMPPDFDETTVRGVMVSRAPHAANNFLKALRGFYKWAGDMGHIEHNPTEKITRNSPKSDGWKIWTPEYLEQFREHWNAKSATRCCFEIALATGLRRSDLVLLAHEHLHGDFDGVSHIEIVAQKTGVTCYIPFDAEMSLWIIPRQDEGAFIRRENGKPFTANSIGAWFNKACLEAGIPPEMRLHSLRKTAATMDAENGWTASELMAKYGWLKMSEAELYTKQADRKRLALNAGKTKPEKTI